LQILRGLHPGEIKRSGAAIVEVVRAALATPESSWPEPLVVRADDPEISAVADLLDVFLRARAFEANIGPSYLGTRADLAALIDHVRGGEGEPLPHLLSGWRRGLVGDELVSLIEGRLCLSIDPLSGRVVASAR
jgi:ribonuclease D